MAQDSKTKRRGENLEQQPTQKERLLAWANSLFIGYPYGTEDDAAVIEILAKFADFKQWAKIRVTDDDNFQPF